MTLIIPHFVNCIYIYIFLQSTNNSKIKVFFMTFLYDKFDDDE